MVRRNLLIGGIMICAALMLTNCENIRCIKGNDNIVTEEVDKIEPFNRIRLEASYDVSITQDTITKVSILADDNLIPYITTEVAGNELILTTANRRCLRSKNDIRVYVSTPNVRRIELDGSGDIVTSDITLAEDSAVNRLDIILDGSGNIDLGNVFCTDLNAEVIGSGEMFFSEIDAINLDVFVGGSGDIIFQGGVGSEGIYVVDGSGNIEADKVELDRCVINIYGSGDIYVWAYKSLSGEILGSGNVFYRALPLDGGPFIEEKGSGRALPLSN